MDNLTNVYYKEIVLTCLFILMSDTRGDDRRQGEDISKTIVIAGVFTLSETIWVHLIANKQTNRQTNKQCFIVYLTLVIAFEPTGLGLSSIWDFYDMPHHCIKETAVLICIWQVSVPGKEERRWEGVKDSIFWNMHMAWCFSTQGLVLGAFFPSGLRVYVWSSCTFRGSRKSLRCFSSLAVIRGVLNVAEVLSTFPSLKWHWLMSWV